MALNKIIVISSIFFKFLFDSINIIPLESLLGLSGACVAILLPIAIFLLDGNVKDDSLDKFVLVKYVLQLKKLGISLVFIFVPLLFWTSKFGSIFKWIALMFLIVGYYLFFKVLKSLCDWILSPNKYDENIDIDNITYRNEKRLEYLKDCSDYERFYALTVMFNKNDWSELVYIRNDVVIDLFFDMLMIYCNKDIGKCYDLISYFKVGLLDESDLKSEMNRGKFNVQYFSFQKLLSRIYNLDDDKYKNSFSNNIYFSKSMLIHYNLLDLLIRHSFQSNNSYEIDLINERFDSIFTNNVDSRIKSNIIGLLIRHLFNVSKLDYNYNFKEELSKYLISSDLQLVDDDITTKVISDFKIKYANGFKTFYLAFNNSNNYDNGYPFDLLHDFKTFSKEIQFYLYDFKFDNNCFNFVFCFITYFLNMPISKNITGNDLIQFAINFNWLYGQSWCEVYSYDVSDDADAEVSEKSIDEISEAADKQEKKDETKAFINAFELYRIIYECNFVVNNIDDLINSLNNEVDNLRDNDPHKLRSIGFSLSNMEVMLNSIKQYQDDNNKTA